MAPLVERVTQYFIELSVSSHPPRHHRFNRETDRVLLRSFQNLDFWTELGGVLNKESEMRGGPRKTEAYLLGTSG